MTGPPCLGAINLFFPALRANGSEDPECPSIPQARAVCAVCPADSFNKCLTDMWREPYGVSAGMTALERRQARKTKLTPEHFYKESPNASD